MHDTHCSKSHMPFCHPNHLSKYWPPTNHRPVLILSPKPPVKVLTPNQSQAWSHSFTQTTCQSTDRQPITGVVSFFHPNHLSKHWPTTNHRPGLILSSSNTRFLTEWVFVPLWWLSDANTTGCNYSWYISYCSQIAGLVQMIHTFS